VNISELSGQTFSLFESKCPLAVDLGLTEVIWGELRYSAPLSSPGNQSAFLQGKTCPQVFISITDSYTPSICLPLGSYKEADKK
jgi:hypothetical protein